MKRKILSILLALVLVVSFSLVTAVPVGAVATLEVSKWTEDVANPIFDPAAKAYYPTVVKVSDSDYRMWYGSDSGVGYATSPDGLGWTEQANPVTGLVNANHPLVEYYGDGFAGSNTEPNASAETMYYRMWYWPGLSYSINDIRYAESPNGTTWYNDQPLQNGTVPIISGGDPWWNRGSYGPSDVLYNPGASNTGTDWTFTMYYDGTTGGDESIGIGFSDDGIIWTGYDSGNDGKADPVLTGSDSDGDWDKDYVSRCTVIKGGDGTYRMWFSGGILSMNHGIGYATSSDGINWDKDANNPIFHKTDGISWRADRSYCPVVIEDGGIYKMWFSGKDAGGNYAIGYATNTNVDPDYTTIQDAINGANAGDTIDVAAGSYTENVDVNQQVAIIGTGQANTIVTAADWEDHVFKVTADGVSISALTATGANRDSYNSKTMSGIYIDADNCIIDSVTAEDNNVGIFLDHSVGSTVTGCTATSNMRIGIYLKWSDGNEISNNDASSNDVSGTSAETASWVGIGIYLEYSSNNQLTGNTANRNKGGSTYSGIGIYLDKCETGWPQLPGNVLIDNTANENECLGDMEMSGIGILLWQAGGTSDSQTILTGNTANGNTYAGTTREKSGSGIVLYQTHYADLTGNTVNSNQANGLYSEGAIGNFVHHNVVTGTTATGNEIGFYLVNDASTYTNNTITGNTDGVRSDSYGGMQVTATALNYNNISGNGNYGVNNIGTDLLNAECNWWGDATGPAHASNPHGSAAGDVVSNNVDFTPWYATAATTLGTQNVSIEHSSILAYSDTIQGGIDAAVDDDTVIVAAGTYSENITIDKSLIVEGANHGVNATAEERGPESIINAQGEQMAVLINGAQTVVTFDGFTVEKEQTAGILAGAFAPEWGDDPLEVHILNNIVKPPTIDPPHNNCIQVGDGTTGTVIGNEVSGAFLESEEWAGSGILVAGSSNVTVSNNYVHDCELGIAIIGYEYKDAPAVNNLIENNWVEDNVCGISPQAKSIGTIIRHNDVLNNDVGIGSLAFDYPWQQDTPSGTQVHYNDIVGNENYGVESSVWFYQGSGEVLAEEIDAKYNWWGGIGGPGGEGLGNGDNVTANVDYDPWLTETQAKTVTDGIAYFGSTISLEPGWNTLSVPLKLKDNKDSAKSANTIAEIMNLGDFLTNENVQIVYQYNSGSGWKDIGASDTELVPLRGYYIKILGTDTVDFPVLYSGTLGLPTLDLSNGWNLIGSGFGIDKTEGDYGIAATNDLEDGQKDVATALYSIKDKCSVVVSPSTQGQVAAWGTTVIDSEKVMIVGEAYWVFMTTPVPTLAGFEVTPIYYLP